ncbi:hypothetical protein L7F22_001445 [Adiantum nelumboides]|nr:hypothetical protein [Adiantum nelumboides]
MPAIEVGNYSAFSGDHEEQVNKEAVEQTTDCQEQVEKYQITDEGHVQQSASNQGRPGYIFLCRDETQPEHIHEDVFGLPVCDQMALVQKVKKGMTIFLFNNQRKVLHGIYEATSDGGMTLVIEALGSSYTTGQVRISQIRQCPPLTEEEFKHVLSPSNYNVQLQRLTVQVLNHKQVERLKTAFGLPQSLDLGGYISTFNRSFYRLGQQHTRSAPEQISTELQIPPGIPAHQNFDAISACWTTTPSSPVGGRSGQMQEPLVPLMPAPSHAWRPLAGLGYEMFAEHDSPQVQDSHLTSSQGMSTSSLSSNIRSGEETDVERVQSSHEYYDLHFPKLLNNPPVGCSGQMEQPLIMPAPSQAWRPLAGNLPSHAWRPIAGLGYEMSAERYSPQVQGSPSQGISSSNNRGEETDVERSWPSWVQETSQNLEATYQHGSLNEVQAGIGQIQLGEVVNINEQATSDGGMTLVIGALGSSDTTGQVRISQIRQCPPLTEEDIKHVLSPSNYNVQLQRLTVQVLNHKQNKISTELQTPPGIPAHQNFDAISACWTTTPSSPVGGRSGQMQESLVPLMPAPSHAWRPIAGLGYEMSAEHYSPQVQDSHLTSSQGMSTSSLSSNIRSGEETDVNRVQSSHEYYDLHFPKLLNNPPVGRSGQMEQPLIMPAPSQAWRPLAGLGYEMSAEHDSPQVQDSHLTSSQGMSSLSMSNARSGEETGVERMQSSHEYYDLLLNNPPVGRSGQMRQPLLPSHAWRPLAGLGYEMSTERYSPQVQGSSSQRISSRNSRGEETDVERSWPSWVQETSQNLEATYQHGSLNEVQAGIGQIQRQRARVATGRGNMGALWPSIRR